MRKLVALLAVTVMAAPVMAQTILTPHVAGSLQTPAWDPAANPMTETAPGSGIWHATFTGLAPGARHEFKITDGTWGNTLPGPNSWLFADGTGNITVGYDSNTYADGWSPTFDRMSLSTDPGTWTVAGSFQMQLGGASDWANGDPNTAMTPMGGGIHMFEAVLTPGFYSGKAVVTGSWDSITWDNRSVNTANWDFTTDAVNDTVRFWVDSFAGTSKIEVVPEPTTLALLGLGAAALIRRRR